MRLFKTFFSFCMSFFLRKLCATTKRFFLNEIKRFTERNKFISSTLSSTMKISSIHLSFIFIFIFLISFSLLLLPRFETKQVRKLDIDFAPSNVPSSSPCLQPILLPSVVSSSSVDKIDVLSLVTSREPISALPSVLPSSSKI